MRSWIVILYIIATKTKYLNGLNAAPDIMIIHLSRIKIKNFKKCAEKRQKHSSH